MLRSTVHGPRLRAPPFHDSGSIVSFNPEVKAMSKIPSVGKHLIYIDGAWVESTSHDTLPVINPATEAVEAESASASEEDVAKAVGAAACAFPACSTVPVAERCDYLNRLHSAYVARADEIAALITSEMGAPITQSKKVHTAIPGDVIKDTATLARRYAYSEELDGSLFVREPYGIVGAVTPWNNPLYMMFLKVVPALAAGCTVVH